MPIPNSILTDMDGQKYRLECELGTGGQAVVWRAMRLADSRQMAIKLFFKIPPAQQRNAQVARLNRVIEKARQIAESLSDAQVCFPRAVISSSSEFGVIMELAVGKPLSDSSLIDCGSHDQQDKYVSNALRAALMGRLKHWHLLLAAFHLARAVNVIHKHGMTHCDLSLGNVFVDPDTGSVSLIDCDNLACLGFLPPTIRGTPGFRAPELIRDDAHQMSAQTDAHSLAVLIFQLIMLRHPLIGRRTPNPNPPEDRDREDAAFGAGAFFTDDPKKHTNKFSDGLPFAALPRFLRELFYAAFVNGLSDPSQRPSAGRWARDLWQSLECMTECAQCRQRFFLSDSDAVCLFCKATNRRQRWWLVFDNGRRMLAEPGRKLYEHHLLDREFQFTKGLAQIQFTPQRDTWMMNLGSATWNLRTEKNGMTLCPPERAFPFNGVKAVEFGHGRTAEIQKV